MTLIEALDELIEATEEHLSDYGFTPDYSGFHKPPEYVEALKIVKEWLYGTGEEKPIGLLKPDDHPSSPSPRR